MKTCNQARVVVAGGMNVDLVVRTQHLPRPGETVHGSDLARVAGGKGLNQATAAARAGGAVHLIGVIGDDENGRTLLECLRDTAVDCSGISVVTTTHTGVAMIAVADDGENLIVVASGANARATAATVTRARTALEMARVVVCQLEWPLPAVSALLAESPPGTLRILNAAPSGPVEASLLANVDVLIVNEIEAEALSGLDASDIDSACKAARELQRQGPRAVVVTLGSRGALVASPDGLMHQAPPDVTVVDTTAAGDTFVGALAASLGKERSLSEASRFAVTAGSLACTVLGAWPSIPHRRDIETLLAKTPLSRSLLGVSVTQQRGGWR